MLLLCHPGNTPSFYVQLSIRAPFVTGGDPVSFYLACAASAPGGSSALISPFAPDLPAAIPPSATLCEVNSRGTTLNHRFVILKLFLVVLYFSCLKMSRGSRIFCRQVLGAQSLHLPALTPEASDPAAKNPGIYTYALQSRRRLCTRRRRRFLLRSTYGSYCRTPAFQAGCSSQPPGI